MPGFRFDDSTASYDELVRNYQSLRDASERERDPQRRRELQQLAEQMYKGVRSVPDFERGDGVPDPPPPNTETPLKQFAGTLALPGAPEPSPAAEAVAQRPEPTAQQVAEAGWQLEANPQSSPFRPGAAYGPGVVGVSTPEAAPAPLPVQAPATDPGLSFDEYRRAAQGRGGAGGGLSVRGAVGNAAAAGAAADAATGREREAILRRGTAAQDDGLRLGEAMAAFATRMKEADGEHQQRLQLARERVGQLIQESKQATEEFRAATRERGFMESLSSGGRVAAAISLALGAIGGGMTGSGQNVALDVLKFRVDTDLRERMMNINAKGQALDAVDGLLQRNLDIFGDEVSAREATRAAIYDELKLEAQRQAAVSGGADKNLAAQQLVAGMDAELARAQEALANQQLQAVLKAARGGGGNLAKLYKDYLGVQEQELKNQKLAKELSGGGVEDDLYSEEGKRAADRKSRVFTNVKPHEDVIMEGTKLLREVGVPSVLTRSRAALDASFADSDSLIATPVGLALSPLRVLSDEENRQMSALFNFTKARVKAMEGGHMSDRDAAEAATKLLRQQWTVSQDALAAQVKDMVNTSVDKRKAALAADPAAARAYERSRNETLEAPSKQSTSALPDYAEREL